MRLFLLALLLGASLNAQNLKFYIDPTNGQAPFSQLQQLPPTFSFPDTPGGQTANIFVRVLNVSPSPVQLNALYVGPTAGSSAANKNFAVTGLQNATLAPQGWKPFYLSFTPSVAGPSTGYLQVNTVTTTGQLQTTAVSTLSGNGLSSSVSLTCSDTLLSFCDGKTPLQPSNSLIFGGPNGVALGTTYPISFTLTNNTSAAIPTPAILSTNYAIAAFTSPDLATLPTSVAPGSTASFKVIFTPQPTPGPSSPENAILTVGSTSYTLQGNALPNSPDITYVYAGTGKPCQGCSAYTINLGPQPDTLSVLFTVTNTEKLGTSYADLVLSLPPTVSGAGFVMSTETLALTGSTSPGAVVPSGQPLTIHPGYSLTFHVTFNGSTAGSGTLPITYTSGTGAGAVTNTVTYTLNAQPAPAVGSAQSDLPGITLMCGTSPCSSQTFSSQQQPIATLQVTTATTAGANLAISFKPLVSGVTDPAVTFITPFTQTNLNFSFQLASLSGLLSNGKPQFTFQTGTTAGTINFTLTDSATQQTITLPPINILPSKVQITSSTAVRQSPNLVLTIAGYDNTYSVGALSFTFNDIAGKLLTPTPIPVDATSAFKQYFFGPTNQAGGAFSLQVTFPVAGDVTQVGSVTANLTNSAGQASVTQPFQ